MGVNLNYECEHCHCIVPGMEAFIGHKILAHSAVSLTIKMPCQDSGTQTVDELFDIQTFE